MRPDWAIFCTLGNFLKSMSTTNLPKSLTFLGNFCKGVKCYHFSSEIIFGQLYRHLAIFSGHTASNLRPSLPFLLMNDVSLCVTKNCCHLFEQKMSAFYVERQQLFVAAMMGYCSFMTHYPFLYVQSLMSHPRVIYSLIRCYRLFALGIVCRLRQDWSILVLFS